MTQPATASGTRLRYGEPSLLTDEEVEALKPQEVKVENPWIYEQTHQEYLDKIKVSIVYNFSKSKEALAAQIFSGKKFAF